MDAKTSGDKTYTYTTCVCVEPSSDDEDRVSQGHPSVLKPIFQTPPEAPMNDSLLQPLNDEVHLPVASPNDSLEKLSEGEGPLLGIQEPARTRRYRLAKQVLMFLGVSVSHIAQLGMTLTWPNVLASDFQHDNTTIYGSSLHLQDWQMDMMGSMVYIGSLPGYVVAGWLARRQGRRWSMVMATVPGLLGWGLIALSLNTHMIIVGRFLTGLAMGLATVSVRIYLAEIADTEIRGAAGMIASAMLEFGGLVTISVGMLLPWYHIAFLVIVILLTFCVFIAPFLPESPMYLAISNRDAEARQVLLSLRGNYVDLDKEISLLKEENKQVEGRYSWDALLKPFILKRILIVTGIFCISNFCGTEVIRANVTRMLQTTGMALNKDLSTILVFVLTLGGNLTMTMTIDRLGRRRCLVASLALLVVAYSVLGLTICLTQSPAVLYDTSSAPGQGVEYSQDAGHRALAVEDWLPAACLMVAALAISLGVGPIPWVVSPEFFPTAIRSQAMSVCTIIGCLIAVIPLQLYSLMQAILTQAGLYWTYACVSMLGIIFTITCVPETGRKKIW
nr:facilitated trehalose transporter Tret1-2 homolog isoform X2 [Procambarus clarkii]